MGCCSKQSSNTEGNIVYLDNNAQNQEISNLLNIKYCSLKEEHLETALTEFVCHNQNFELKLQSDQQTCVVHSAENIEVDLTRNHSIWRKALAMCWSNFKHWGIIF